MTNEPNNWSEIVAKLRRAMGLAPPSDEEADAAMLSAGEIPMSDEDIEAIARQAIGQKTTRPTLEPDYSWLGEQAEDETVDESMLVMNRNKGEEDDEVQRRLKELRRKALESDDANDDEETNNKG